MKKLFMVLGFLILLLSSLSARFIFDGKIILTSHATAKDSVYWLVVEKAGGVLDTVAGFDTLGNVTLYGNIFPSGNFWITAGDKLFWTDATLADTNWIHHDGSYLIINGDTDIKMLKKLYLNSDLHGVPNTGTWSTDGWRLKIDSGDNDAIAYIYFHGTNEALKADSTGELLEWTGIGGIHANVMVSVASDTIASAATLVLTNHNNFVITGGADIDSIDQSCTFPNWAIAYIEFTGTAGFAGVVDGKNLKLNGDFTYSADDMIMLQRRGNIFYEISRSAN